MKKLFLLTFIFAIVSVYNVFAIEIAENTTFTPALSNVTYISPQFNCTTIAVGDYCLNITGGDYADNYCNLSVTPLNITLSTNSTTPTSTTPATAISETTDDLIDDILIFVTFFGLIVTVFVLGIIMALVHINKNQAPDFLGLKELIIMLVLVGIVVALGAIVFGALGTTI